MSLAIVGWQSIVLQQQDERIRRTVIGRARHMTGVPDRPAGRPRPAVCRLGNGKRHAARGARKAGPNLDREREESRPGAADQRLAIQDLWEISVR